MINYKEPGVYLTLENNPKYNTPNTPGFIPVILGVGPSSFTKTFQITRADNEYDVLPSETVTKIITVSSLPSPSPNTKEYEETTDYVLEGNKIKWLSENKPLIGHTYYTKLEFTPTDEQYEPYLASTKEQVISRYGNDLEEDGSLNQISTAAQIALEEGAGLVYILQVNPKPSIIEGYRNAYDKHLKFLTDAYHIVPLDITPEVFMANFNHINLMSTPDERMERTTITGAPVGTISEDADASSVISELGGFVESIGSKRVSVIYPDVATRVMSNGNEYDLGGQYIAAAIAGWRSLHPVQRAMTKAELTSFKTLKGAKLTRMEKNMLASKGVTILEQIGGTGTPIVIRHGLTTDMANLQNKEPSVVAIGDYSSKFFRTGLSPYIGKYNVTPELIVKLKASTNTLIQLLVRQKVIISGDITGLFQDEYRPDTVILKVRLRVPYPCNYIEITLYLD